MPDVIHDGRDFWENHLLPVAPEFRTAYDAEIASSDLDLDNHLPSYLMMADLRLFFAEVYRRLPRSRQAEQRL